MNAIGFKVGRFCTLGEVTIGCDGSNHPNLVRVFADARLGFWQQRAVAHQADHGQCPEVVGPLQDEVLESLS